MTTDRELAMPQPVGRSRNPMRRLYDWVLHWAETPYATPALFILAFAESSFFPVPPDVLLIALALSLPTKAFRYALICSIGSVLGGTFGYCIGAFLREPVAQPFIHFMGWDSLYAQVSQYYAEYGFWIVFTAGFTPIPYKIFTITAAMTDPPIRFDLFLLASIVGRSGRFFLVAALIRIFGPSIRQFIERYFNLSCLAFAILLIGGFVVIKYVF